MLAPTPLKPLRIAAAVEFMDAQLLASQAAFEDALCSAECRVRESRCFDVGDVFGEMTAEELADLTASMHDPDVSMRCFDSELAAVFDNARARLVERLARANLVASTA